MTASLIRSSSAAQRLAEARAWLAERGPAEEVLVIGATPDAANELLRDAVSAPGRSAAFGWHRATLGRLAFALATPRLVASEATPVGPLAQHAVMAQVLDGLDRAGDLGRLSSVADGPGLARAVANTVDELRHALLEPDAIEGVSTELGLAARGYDAALAELRLVDRARLLALAHEAAARDDTDHEWLGLPTLLLDVPVTNESERRLVAEVLRRAPELLATVPAGDEETAARLGELGLKLRDLEDAPDATSLRRLQRHLFERSIPPKAPLDDSLEIVSAPGESRECVEIARRLQRLAHEGTAFDRMAVILRSPEEYRSHLEEAFGRAEIPAHFARGARRPDPSGRAFLALLGCKAERLSARAFAEYLSLGEVPPAAADGGPPAAPPPGDRWVPADEELIPERIAEALPGAAGPESTADDDVDENGDAPDPDTAPVVGGTLRAPRRWEQLLVDAAVIGGRERWEKRLDGLRHEKEGALREIERDDDRRADAIRRDISNLESLGRFALPVLDLLEELPEQARWREWIDRLQVLASRTLRRPERVLAELGKLHPMAEVGPVGLDEVRLILGPRLLEASERPPASHAGQVWIGPADAARGLAFDTVLVPGLAEKLFPRKIIEDPILLDSARRELDDTLTTRPRRVDAERLALRIAVGAARDRVILSYPRLDLEHGRPRVPSFYALEALRAATGELPGFTELGRTASRVGAAARLGWPAPERSDEAIDEAEHDLALLVDLLHRDEAESVGAARFLLEANPHLGRGLRFRAMRWQKLWKAVDGLGGASAGARAAMEGERLAARPFSPTALQNFAACPYRFFLSAIMRLSPREDLEQIEAMNPLQRGSLVHEVLYRYLTRLRDEGRLPVDEAGHAAARAILDEVLRTVARDEKERLCPAIDRVWEAGITSIEADLHEWLKRMVEDDSGFVPAWFELSFGLHHRRKAEKDAASRPDPVQLDGGLQLRGAIDLVERRADGTLRVVDFKTGKLPPHQRVGAVVAGGAALQPVLYALTTERLLADEGKVESGQLYYCTAAGRFEKREVRLDEEARRKAAEVIRIIGEHLERAYLPTYPAKNACTWCDYKRVCGPYEESRAARKGSPKGFIDQLRDLT